MAVRNGQNVEALERDVLARLASYGWAVPETVRPLTEDEFDEHYALARMRDKSKANRIIHWDYTQRLDAVIRLNWREYERAKAAYFERNPASE